MDYQPFLPGEQLLPEAASLKRKRTTEPDAPMSSPMPSVALQSRQAETAPINDTLDEEDEQLPGLMKLPRELRDEIFELLLVPKNTSLCTFRKNRGAGSVVIVSKLCCVIYTLQGIAPLPIDKMI